MLVLVLALVESKRGERVSIIILLQKKRGERAVRMLVVRRHVHPNERVAVAGGVVPVLKIWM
jgi:hypothetical protein